MEPLRVMLVATICFGPAVGLLTPAPALRASTEPRSAVKSVLAWHGPLPPSLLPSPPLDTHFSDFDPDLVSRVLLGAFISNGTTDAVSKTMELALAQSESLQQLFKEAASELLSTKSCPSDERACKQTTGCGFCIPEDYDSSCMSGDVSSPFFAGGAAASGPSLLSPNCSRMWAPARFSTGDAPMACASGDSSGVSVRCYDTCPSFDEAGNQVSASWPVPTPKACKQYDSAFSATRLDLGSIIGTLKNATSVTHYKSVKAASDVFHALRTHGYLHEEASFTREIIGGAVDHFFERGWQSMSGSACQYATNSKWCEGSFYTKVSDWTWKHAVTKWSPVSRVMSRTREMAYQAVPDDAACLMDGVADVASDYGVGGAVESVCSTFASAVVDGAFAFL